MKRLLASASIIAALCFAPLTATHAGSGDLPLQIVQDNQSSLVVSWVPPAGIAGYVFKVDGKRVSNTWNPAQAQAKFGKQAGPASHTYQVVAVAEAQSGQVVYPQAVSQVWAWDARSATVSSSSPLLVARVSVPGLQGGAFFSASVAHTVAPAGTVGYPIPAGPYSGLDPNVPVPIASKPGPTGDHHLYVLDAYGREHDLWAANYNVASAKIASAGGGVSFPATAVSEPSTGDATAARFPLSRGLVTPTDIKSGVIAHSLVMSMPLNAVCNQYPDVYPANTPCNDPVVPYGQWYRLDLNYSCDTGGFDTLTLLVCRALQRYGAFVRDESGQGNNTIAFYGADEVNQGGNAAVWPVPLTWNPGSVGGYNTFAKLGPIPWDRLQALNPPAP